MRSNPKVVPLINLAWKSVIVTQNYHTNVFFTGRDTIRPKKTDDLDEKSD